MNEKKTEAVEVLPPEGKIQKSKVHCGGLLQDIANQLHEEFEAFGKLEKEASFRALRIGILLLKARENLKHGEFEPWIEKNIIEVRRSQAFNYMRLARIFLEQKHIEQDKAYLLCAPKSEPAAVASPSEQKLVQQVFDFIQDKSLNDLFKEHGIKDTHKSKGGNNALTAWLKENYPKHAGKLLHQLPAEIKAAWQKFMHDRASKDLEALTGPCIQSTFKKIAEELAENVLHEANYMHLSKSELEEFYGVLMDAKNVLQKVLRK